MKTTHLPLVMAAALAAAINITSAHAQKFKADVPKSITTPDSVKARIGTLKFFDGFPDEATVVLLTPSLRLSEVHFDRT